MFARLDAVFPGGCHIFLANIYDPTDDVGNPAGAGLPPFDDALPILAASNAIIARCAAEHPSVHLVDMRAAFLGHGIHCTQPWRQHSCWRDPHYWYHLNFEDPNERGYDAIRRLFLREMARALADVPNAVPRTDWANSGPAVDGIATTSNH
jgi:hypothetical protein